MAALEQPDGMRGPLLRSARSLGQAERPLIRTRPRHRVPFDLERLRAVLACQFCESAPPHHDHWGDCPGAQPVVYTLPLLAALAGGLLHRKEAS